MNAPKAKAPARPPRPSRAVRVARLRAVRRMVVALAVRYTTWLDEPEDMGIGGPHR